MLDDYLLQMIEIGVYVAVSFNQSSWEQKILRMQVGASTMHLY